MSGGRSRALIVLGAVLVLLVVGAWAAASLLAPKDRYEVRVSDGTRVLASYTVGELQSLGAVKIVALGKTEQGPSLIRVLEDAGVNDFSRVVIRGAGVRDAGSIVLTRDQVDGDVIFDIANRGTVKIVSPEMAWDERVRDVTEIIVEGAE
ncbi:MAG: hypothetical protein D9V44_10740 [Actinobacteria bacterium]|nr:MAG: hypothetical protein D9V44_10740 [Actinomycetota bacterium]